MQTSDLDYDLPLELIAQHPVEPRDTSRLLRIQRDTEQLSHHHFYDLAQFLNPGDLLIANDTSVINARLLGQKPTGGKAEVLLLRRRELKVWEALVGGRRVREVEFEVQPGHKLIARVIDKLDGPQSLVEFSEPVEPYLAQIGSTPLPPYIHERLSDPSRYQTVYARVAGSAAAPTAGLHFTPSLLKQLQDKGVRVGFVTLHVGLDTFKPIEEDTIEEHAIHSEWCELNAETAALIDATKQAGKRVIAVGTTSARTLESAWQPGRAAGGNAWSGFTRLYITPGYQWRCVDALITNFHLPKSTLLALVGSFAGMPLMRRAYAEAIQERYRFYSFGDAMLIGN